MFTEEQAQAICLTDGPLRIIAGAGTGKTFTIINRIDYLIKEKKNFPLNILVLTFTNKAAHELQERLSQMGHNNVLAMTFHCLAARFLRKFWNNASAKVSSTALSENFDPHVQTSTLRSKFSCRLVSDTFAEASNKDFVILDQISAENLLKQILNDDEIDELKNMIIDLDALRASKILDKKVFASEAPSVSKIEKFRLENILHDYEKLLSDKNAVDFFGLLAAFLSLLKTDRSMKEKCQNFFKYILVDEYQDVNEIQIEILKCLTGPDQNICVVGDSDQTIYSWRGANAKTLADFENIFPNSKTIFLTKNYRNPSAILEGAQALIKNNPDRIEHILEPSIKSAVKINLWESKNEYAEIDSMFYLLEKYLGSMSDMHIADNLDADKESRLRKMSDIAILYRTQEQGRIISTELAKKGYPYQISNLKYFWANKKIVDFIESLKALSDAAILQDTSLKFSEWILKNIEDFVSLNNFSDIQKNKLNHLVSYAIAFDDLLLNDALKGFLDEVSVSQESDNLVYGDRINLLTLHAAKGLEFPIVFILGLNEDEIPYKKLKDDPYYLAEERRLLYVGMTRAKEELHLFYKQKFRDKIFERSRFLGEIGLENLALQSLPEERLTRLKRKELKKAQLSLF